MATTERIARVTCTHDCPDACAMLVTVRDGRAVDVSPNPAHPVTGRHLCVKVDRYLDRVYHPDRLLSPLRRRGAKGDGSFESISWDDALDVVATRWRAIIAAEGAAAILPYSYLGSMGSLSAFGTMHALFHRLGATRLERTICGGQNQGLTALVGATWTDPENIEHARLIVAWGIDLVSTSIHTWDIVQRARRCGARLVVIDPYRSRTAERADLHVPIRPGTDGALALGMLHVIFREGLQDRDYIGRFTTGVESLESLIGPWTPQAAARATGLEPGAIAALAREYATARPAAIRHGVGMQRAAGSGMALRAIHCLAAATGQWRYPAGGIADARSVRAPDIGKLMRPELGPPPPRTLNMIQLGRHLTDPDLSPPIRALFVWSANPAVIAPEQRKVVEGLRREDLFTVVHEQFMTDTARHADIVLPATTMLEQEDLVGSWGFNYVALNERAIAPVGEARSTAEVVRLLAARLELDDEIFGLGDRELIALALRGSPAEQEGASLERLAAESFVRVGPARGAAPFAEGQFPTPSGKFEFASDSLARAGLGPVPLYVPPAESPETNAAVAQRYPLRLLTLKRHYSINSSYGALPVLARAEPEPLLELHRDDARARGIVEGQTVRVWNDRGSVSYRAHLTDKLRPGTVAAPFGPSMRGGASVNCLTSDRLSDLGNGPTFCDTLVQVSAV